MAYNNVEITYTDGTQENLELTIPFNYASSNLGRIAEGVWLYIDSLIGIYVINKDEIRHLRFHNDWKEPNL